MKIQVSNPGFGDFIKAIIFGSPEEIRAAVTWARENFDENKVVPYDQILAEGPSNLFRTTIMFSDMSDVLIFKLTWA